MRIVMNTEQMPRFTPPTPRSRRLGRELRRLREAAGLTLDQAGEQIGSSPSRISRIESGEIKVRPGGVLELLLAYGVPIDDEQGRALVALSRTLREPGWWQRLDLPTRYATYISYEVEAVEARVFEPTVVPGLLQTEAYARAVIAVGREDDPEAIEARVQARMTRQEVVTRRRNPLQLYAVIGEAALHCEVGGPEVMAEQRAHLARAARAGHVNVTVVPYRAGAELAVARGFTVLRFAKGESDPLVYEEAAGHELFVEQAADVIRLLALHARLTDISVPIGTAIKEAG